MSLKHSSDFIRLQNVSIRRSSSAATLLQDRRMDQMFHNLMKWLLSFKLINFAVSYSLHTAMNHCHRIRTIFTPHIIFIHNKLMYLQGRDSRHKWASLSH